MKNSHESPAESPSIPLPKDPRHQRFADLVMQGVAAAEAYRQAGFPAKTAAAQRSGASRMLTYANVKRYMEAMQAVQSTKALVEKEWAIKRTFDILNSKPSEASMDSPLCEVRWTAEGPVPVFPSKAKMLDRLAKMMGFDAATKVEVDGLDEMVEVMAEIGRKSVTLPRDSM